VADAGGRVPGAEARSLSAAIARTEVRAYLRSESPGLSLRMTEISFWVCGRVRNTGVLRFAQNDGNWFLGARTSAEYRGSSLRSE
jgi:hypothetical protein